MRTFSIGELHNQLSEKAKAKKEMLQMAFSNMAAETRNSLRIGLNIIWYGLCGSFTVYMVVKSFMLAVS